MPRIVPGLSPATLTAPPDAEATRIHVIGYGPDAIEEVDVQDPAGLTAICARWPVVWVDVTGLRDVETIRRLGDVLGLHGLALEDVFSSGQRDKVEDYAQHVFVVARTAALEERLVSEQLSLFLGHGLVVTFSDRPLGQLDPVRQRLRAGKGRTRTSGADYLAYALLDAVVDNLFPVLEAFGDRIEVLEEEVLGRPHPDVLAKVHAVRHDLVALRRLVWPKREALNRLVRDDFEDIKDETRLYLRDCQDHAVQAMEILESYREMAATLLEAYLSAASNRMNEVMKVLTIIATIFIPLTFLVGLYGMNFRYMPELQVPWGYPALLLVMLVLAGLLVLYFRRKGWIGR